MSAADLRRSLKVALRRASRSLPSRSAPLPPARWGLERKGHELALEGCSLPALRARWGSPLHVVHAAKLRENARAFQRVPRAAAAGCEVFVSYKTNPVPGVLALLHELGVGAEVISHQELWLARRLGVPPARIVYNGPAKSDASVREAAEMGVETLNLNHREEIPRVARLAAETGRRLRVGLRVSVPQSWSFQFGTPIAGGAALAAFREALSFPSLQVVGLHVHRGGMLRGADELGGFAQAALDFTDTLASELGLTLEILNFGGSLATPTVRGLSAREVRLNQSLLRDLTPPDPGATLSIERYVALLLERVEEHHRRRGRARPRVFVEPGRALTGNTQLLLATVLSVKEEGDGPAFVIADAGINHAEAVRGEYHQLFAASRAGVPSARVYTVVGPICSPGDTLYRAVGLPALAPGDALAIMDAGAYFVPFSTSFSFPRPAVVAIDGGACRLLRRAERFEDVMACDVL
jgi:diaminopimelate decarboxylase